MGYLFWKIDFVGKMLQGACIIMQKIVHIREYTPGLYIFIQKIQKVYSSYTIFIIYIVSRYSGQRYSFQLVITNLHTFFF